jgi:hypothetical protein
MYEGGVLVAFRLPICWDAGKSWRVRASFGIVDIVEVVLVLCNPIVGALCDKAETATRNSTFNQEILCLCAFGLWGV